MKGKSTFTGKLWVRSLAQAEGAPHLCLVVPKIQTFINFNNFPGIRLVTLGNSYQISFDGCPVAEKEKLEDFLAENEAALVVQ